CVPAVLADVVEARESGLLPRLRTAVVAGARLSGALRRRAEAAGLSVVEYYGATELSFVAVDPDGAGLRPFPGVELDLRNGGEIWVRSPYLALGYLDPATGGPLRRDPGGWCTVGDHGTLRPDGSLAVHGRGDRALSVGGHTVLTADVEAVLAEVDGVSELVCLAQPHHRLGERVVAAVRPAAGCDPVPDLRRAARTRLPVAARPVRYLLFADFPRTPGGKVDRTRLRDQVLADLGARPGAGPAHRSAAPERASAARDAPEPAPAVAGPPSGRPAAPSGTEPAAHLSGSARLPG
ncbi:MAG TPA: class I adenylate-forming enzyme family protein, partial [Kineosporiaceae bacterium]|nr:class I adenylate-forming enzyme family protein [Kineosporiaceae bacterium]